MFQLFKLDVFVNSLIYSMLGLVILWFSFRLLDWLTPYNLWKELLEEKNVALAILVAGFAIGVCIIIAAAIH